MSVLLLGVVNIIVIVRILFIFFVQIKMTVNKDDNEDHYHKSNADTCEKHDLTFKVFKKVPVKISSIMLPK